MIPFFKKITFLLFILSVLSTVYLRPISAQALPPQNCDNLYSVRFIAKNAKNNENQNLKINIFIKDKDQLLRTIDLTNETRLCEGFYIFELIDDLNNKTIKVQESTIKDDEVIIFDVVNRKTNAVDNTIPSITNSEENNLKDVISKIAVFVFIILFFVGLVQSAKRFKREE